MLIADDDSGMRLVLKKIIEKTNGFSLAGEAQDGEEVLRLVALYKPDIIFMDVEMPLMTGVECAKQLADLYPKTIIIFATAHDEYMSDAFSVYAFDYLNKPFKVERVMQTLNRIKEMGQFQATDKINDIFRHEKGLDKLLVKNKDGINLIDMNDIILVQREERCTIVCTLKDRYVTSEGLSELEDRLDKTLFFRSHKSYIINLSMISKIENYGRWTYIVKFKNTSSDALLTSERYDVLEKFFNI